MDDFISKISNINLLTGEEVVFEDDAVILTNKRLFTDFKNGNPKNSIEIGLVDGVRQIDGGQENKIWLGMKALCFGIGLSLIQFLLDYFFITDSSTTQLIRILNTIFFIIGAIAMGAGLYLIINSLLRVRPHTTLIFVRFKGKDLRVTYHDRNAPKALQLKEVFMKQQRLLKL